MFKAKIFSTEIEPACCYCLKGFLSQDKQVILCEKYGAMPLNHSCKKFVYDPISRIPPPHMTLSTHDPEEFIL